MVEILLSLNHDIEMIIKLNHRFQKYRPEGSIVTGDNSLGSTTRGHRMLSLVNKEQLGLTFII